MHTTMVNPSKTTHTSSQTPTKPSLGNTAGKQDWKTQSNDLAWNGQKYQRVPEHAFEDKKEE